MTKLENYTIKELNEKINNNELTIKKMVENYLDETEESSLVYLSLDVEKDLDYDFTQYENLEELEDFLLYESEDFYEEKTNIKYNLALSIYDAYIKEIEDEAELDWIEQDIESEILDDIMETLLQEIYFEITFENETKEFKERFYSTDVY